MEWLKWLQFGVVFAGILVFDLLATLLVRAAVIRVGTWFGVWNPAWYRLTIVVPWRTPLRWYLALRAWWARLRHSGNGASAGWLSPLGVLTMVYEPGKLFLGQPWAHGFPLLQPIGIKTERHCVIISPAGTGKTVMMATQIALHTGSAFTVDPKGTLSRLLAPVTNAPVLDPQNIVPRVRRISWNIYEDMRVFVLRHGPDSAVRYSAIIAEALIKTDPHEHQKFFSDAARAFLIALILHVFTAEPPTERNLVRVRDLLMRGYVQAAPDGFEFLLEEMTRNAAYNGLIAQQADALLAMGDGKERAAILSTARVSTAFLDFPEIQAISRRSDIKLEDLKLGNLRLFLAAPATDVAGPLAPWFRLAVATVLYTMESTPGRIDPGCLVAIDEFPAIGPVSSLKTAAPLLRSAGVRLLLAAQDKSQIVDTYPSGHEGFIANAEVVLWMGANSLETSTHLQNSLGSHMCTEVIDPGSGWFAKTKRPKRTQRVERLLMPADEIRRFLHKRRMIVSVFGRPAVRLRPSPYYEVLPVWLYAPDPDFTEAPLRAFTRALIRRFRSWRSQLKGATPAPVGATTTVPNTP